MESDVARVGYRAPDFELGCVLSDSKAESTVSLSDFRGRWLVIVFYPRDFSFVCPTELAAFSTRIHEFQSRECDVVGISVDSLDSHRAWLSTSADKGGVFGLRFALASDPTGEVSRAYGVFHEANQVAGRGIFIVDPAGTLQYLVVHNMNVGRSTDETLRVLDALREGGLCPAGWTRADGTIDPLLDLGEGRVLGHFKIERFLGEGGFGWVYAARDMLLDRPVALKVGRSTAAATREAVLQEARAAAKLQHPYVCAVLAVEQVVGVPLIVMEYLPGESLAHRLAAGPLPADESLRIARHITSAIAASHAAGVCHGDIKPGNILFSSANEAKVADFGMARAMSVGRGDGKPDDEVDVTRSLDGAIRGTPAYMSPEQTEGAAPTPAGDVFSMGLLLYELVTGRRAVRGAGAAESLAAIRTLDREALAGELPAPYAQIVHSMLSPLPHERPTMQRVAEQFSV